MHDPSALDEDWTATLADWLAGLFAAPMTIGTVAGYRAGLGALLLDTLDQQPGCASGARAMQLAMADCQSDAAIVRHLGMAFVQLFEGVGGPLTVSPFESVHTGPTARLFQRSSAALDQLLREVRTAPQTGLREPSDHISIELALFARLLRDRASVGRQIELLDVHLMTWAPAFAEAIRVRDHTGFYAGAASILIGFLREARASLREISHRCVPANQDRITLCPSN